MRDVVICTPMPSNFKESQDNPNGDGKDEYRNRVIETELQHIKDDEQFSNDCPQYHDPFANRVLVTVLAIDQVKERWHQTKKPFYTLLPFHP